MFLSLTLPGYLKAQESVESHRPNTLHPEVRSHQEDGRFGPTHQGHHFHQEVGHRVAFTHPTEAHNHPVRHPDIQRRRGTPAAKASDLNLHVSQTNRDGRKVNPGLGTFRSTHQYRHFHHLEHHPEVNHLKVRLSGDHHHHQHLSHLPEDFYRQKRELLEGNHAKDFLETPAPILPQLDGKKEKPSIGIHGVTHQYQHYHHDLGHQVQYQHPEHYRPPGHHPHGTHRSEEPVLQTNRQIRDADPGLGTFRATHQFHRRRHGF